MTWPTRDTSQCASKWYYMGKMPVATFYRKYLALNCWVPFAPSSEDDIGEISYFVQVSDSSNFC